MDKPEHPMYTVVLSSSGREHRAGFHLTVWETVGEETHEQRVQYDGTVKLDEEQYGPAEWVREVMLGIIEGL